MTVRVLHVLPTAERRGAQVFCADLAGALGSEADQRVALLRSGGTLRFPVPVDRLRPGTRIPGLRVGAGSVRGLRRLVRTWTPDVVLAHGGEPLKNAALAGAPRIVYRKIGLAPPAARTGARRRAHARLLGRARWVVAVAEAARREAEEVFGVSSERLLVIPTAVDPARLEGRGGEAIRAELGIPGDAPVVLSIGALDPEKDPLAHLDVGRRVLAAIPEARHVVAGDGPLRKPVARAARDPRILLVGERRDVGRLLAAADVLVVASRSEGLPASVLEAGVTGVPVAAFAVGGVPELVEDGVTGLLVGAGDRAALAAAAVRLLRDRSLGRRVAAAARERSRGFHIGEVTGPYLELFAAMGRAKAGR